MFSHSTTRRVICTTSLLLALTIVPLTTRALTVENVTFADSVTIGGTPVPLRNAALLPYLKFIKAYAAALYLPEDTLR